MAQAGERAPCGVSPDAVWLNGLAAWWWWLTPGGGWHDIVARVTVAGVVGVAEHAMFRSWSTTICNGSGGCGLRV